MTIFAVLLPGLQPNLTARIQSEFPNNHLEVTPTQWLISASGTALEITTKIGIYDPKNPDQLAIGTAIVFATSSYHGRAPTPVWDWIKNKLEAQSVG